MSKPGTKKPARLAAAERARRAAELCIQGMTFKEIAKELGYAGPSGAHVAVESHRVAIPRAAIEELRIIQTARCTRAQDAALELLDHDDEAIRLKAGMTVARLADTLGRISGLVKAPPPMLLVNVGKTEQKHDLSRLSIEKVGQLRALILEMSSAPIPAIDVTGTTVEDDHAERRDDSGEGT